MPEGSIGTVCVPEKYHDARFDVLTLFNPEIPLAVSREYEKLMLGDSPRRQMTLKMLADEIELKSDQIWYAFVSAIITKFGLVSAIEKGRLFCGRCQCGSLRTANSARGSNGQTHGCLACEQEVDLRLNPQVLAGLADETGVGFCDGERQMDDHGVLLTDLAWTRLLVGSMHDELQDGAADSEGSLHRRAKQLEENLLYERMTFVFCWTGAWNGGRSVIVDIL
jgi:hypothetical protein